MKRSEPDGKCDSADGVKREDRKHETHKLDSLRRFAIAPLTPVPPEKTICYH